MDELSTATFIQDGWIVHVSVDKLNVDVAANSVSNGLHWQSTDAVCAIEHHTILIVTRITIRALHKFHKLNKSSSEVLDVVAGRSHLIVQLGCREKAIVCIRDRYAVKTKLNVVEKFRR